MRMERSAHDLIFLKSANNGDSSIHSLGKEDIFFSYLDQNVSFAAWFGGWALLELFIKIIVSSVRC